LTGFFKKLFIANGYAILVQNHD